MIRGWLWALLPVAILGVSLGVGYVLGRIARRRPLPPQHDLPATTLVRGFPKPLHDAPRGSQWTCEHGVRPPHWCEQCFRLRHRERY